MRGKGTIINSHFKHSMMEAWSLRGFLVVLIVGLVWNDHVAVGGGASEGVEFIPEGRGLGE